MTPPETKKIVYVDASSLKSDSNCDRRYLLHIIRGYTKGLRSANYKAGYGTAFHAGLELYYKIPVKDRTERLPEVIAAALTHYTKYRIDPIDFRTAAHLEQTIQAYHNRYKFGDSIAPLTTPEGQPLLESKFCLPVYEDSALVVYLTGTIDMVAEYCGQVVIVDHKSTGTNRPAEFFNEFDMNIQTQLYVRQWRKMSGSTSYVPIIVNGVFIKKPTQKAADAGKFDGVSFERSRPIEYTDEQMGQFEEYLQRMLENIIVLAKAADDWLGQPNYAACHGRFGTCLFYELCKAPPKLQSTVLRSAYVTEEYNPLSFND